jgi:oligopeptide transport system permease protein
MRKPSRSIAGPLAVVVGLTLGINASLNMGKFWDYFCIIIAIIGVSVPDFILGSLLQYVFALKLKLLPVARWMGFKYTILPVFGLSLYTVALITRLMRVSMLEVINQDYILTAKAKGINKTSITYKHVLRNSIMPVVTILGPRIAGIITGTLVVESIFAIPGLGRELITAIGSRDYTVVMSLTVFFAFLYILSLLLVDIAYVFIDPRIKLDANKK